MVLLSLVTLGIYGFYWQYVTFNELKAYSGEGIGGGLGILLAFIFGIPTAFVLPSEAGHLYGKAGQNEPISVTTGFWHFIPFVGWIVWTIKVQRALNDYWKSQQTAA